MTFGIFGVFIVIWSVTPGIYSTESISCEKSISLWNGFLETAIFHVKKLKILEFSRQMLCVGK
jgi:hypothetical protein